MTPPQVRKAALTVHLVCSVGWIGAALAYLALGLAATVSVDAGTIRAVWVALEIVGWAVVVPFAVAALLTGVVVALASPWGLLQHWWVLISLVLTTFAAAVTVLHMPTVSATAHRAAIAGPDELASLGGDLFHPSAGLALLLVITVLNVYKPRGRIRPRARRRNTDPLTLSG
jgi:hypothetical protein